MTADKVRQLLQLEPLPMEGGYFRETYGSHIVVPAEQLGGLYSGPRRVGTAIYYLITPESFSALHRVPGSEIFHFYRGDPAEMLQLLPDGSSRTITMGTEFEKGYQPQVIVRGGVWQGLKLVTGGRWALLGTTMSPGFDYADYQHGNVEQLVAQYPGAADKIRSYGGR